MAASTFGRRRRQLPTQCAVVPFRDGWPLLSPITWRSDKPKGVTRPTRRNEFVDEPSDQYLTSSPLEQPPRGCDRAAPPGVLVGKHDSVKHRSLGQCRHLECRRWHHCERRRFSGSSRHAGRQRHGATCLHPWSGARFELQLRRERRGPHEAGVLQRVRRGRCPLLRDRRLPGRRSLQLRTTPLREFLQRLRMQLRRARGRSS